MTTRSKKAAPESEGTTTITVHLPDETIGSIDSWAEERGFTRDEAVLGLIEWAFRAHFATDKKRKR